MIFCENITDNEYSKALHLLHRASPAQAWGLTFRSEGDKPDVLYLRKHFGG